MIEGGFYMTLSTISDGDPFSAAGLFTSDGSIVLNTFFLLVRYSPSAIVAAPTHKREVEGKAEALTQWEADL